ncbi:MAG TPA: hypothetical protein VMB34_11970 [Acetobacteraceae bacterium]|nr:hypothetical protein [Acetobacteraceae bacterium]
MPQQTATQQPARVPGDAEAPPKTEADRTAAEAVKRSDRTEPTRSAQGQAKKPEQDRATKPD